MVWIGEGNFPGRWRFIWVLLLVLASCQWSPAPREPRPLPPSVEGFGEIPLDSLGSLLLTGDLIFRTGKDMTSFMLRQLNLRDKRYSHCGLVRWEGGYPFVYHSIGGEENPDLALRRDSLKQWIDPRRNERASAYRLPFDSLDRKKLGNQARRYYEKRIPFDMAFDLSTDDRFYCAEFVYKTLRLAEGGTWDVPLSHFRGYTFIGIDDLYLNADGDWIWELEYKQ